VTNAHLKSASLTQAARIYENGFAVFSRPFVRFLLVGGAAALLNILVRLIFNLWMTYELAIAAAYLVAMTTAFILNRTYVFHARKGAILRQYVRFTLVNLVALAQVWVVSVGLARWLFPSVGFEWHDHTVAHAIGVLSPVVTSYVGHKFFTFGHDGAPTQ
jgi:putative flippase GtrA